MGLAGICEKKERTCSGLVLVLQSEERPDGELMLYAGVVEQRLLLKLLKLLRVEAEGVRPEVSARVDEGRAQGFWKRGRCIIFTSASCQKIFLVSLCFIVPQQRERRAKRGRGG